MVTWRSCTKVTIRTSCFLFLLGICAFMIQRLFLMIKQNERLVTKESMEIHSKVVAEINVIVSLIMSPIKTSAQNLAVAVGSSLNNTNLTFNAIEEKVAPILFVALNTMPFLSSVGYCGLDGLLFSFDTTRDEYQVNYCNSSKPLECYSQPVDQGTGKPLGNPILTTSQHKMDKAWLDEALDYRTGFASIGREWNKDQDLQLFHTVPVDGFGLLSLGFMAQKIIDHFTNINLQGGYFHLTLSDDMRPVNTKLPNTQIRVGNGTAEIKILSPDRKHDDRVFQVKCEVNEEKLDSITAQINGQEKYTFYCAPMRLAGIRSVYVLAFPYNGSVSLAGKGRTTAHTLLVLLFIILLVSISIFLYFIISQSKREMVLCAALVKQKEATQQAERKSMNKSVAFASASHDARASLTVITRLLELSREDVSCESQLARNLGQMSVCANDLLGILNTVLDTSKIEAGKMQLQDEEFNLAQLLEDVVDVYYLLGMRKGVDVVFDPCDGSIFRSRHVRGDRGKLKQILGNLIANAIKFTQEGHVTIRATANKRVSLENSIIASNANFLTKCLPWLWYQNSKRFKDLDALQTVQNNPNCIEIKFEVEDTGKGIPKDKWKSVFENFVQVNETDQGQEGIGLGLGIVQSLVRLMGGEIGIIEEKESWSRGTCFKFNVFLTCENDIEEQREFHRHYGPTSRSMAFKSDGSSSSSSSHVVLVIASDERRKISKRLFERLGIKVSAIKYGRDLYLSLDRIMHRSEGVDLRYPGIGKCDMTLVEQLNLSTTTSDNSGFGEVEEGSFATIKDGTGYPIMPCTKSISKSWQQGFILIVVDSRAGLYTELCSIISNFRKDTQNSPCKIVWLDNPAHSGNLQPPLCDYRLMKPFHGSRLYRVLGILPEYGGKLGHFRGGSLDGFSVPSFKEEQLEQIVVQDSNEQNIAKPLYGKRVLLVEDKEILCKVTSASLCKLGAEFDVCRNGKEALHQVCEALNNQKKGACCSKAFCYDYIFMDCEMPILNGYEATRLIRMEEKQHNMHIPIIALTASATDEERSKTLEAGMDVHLTKPLRTDELLEAIRTLSQADEQEETS